MTENGIKADTEMFEWLPDYEVVLEKLAEDDVPKTEWTRLRHMIKHKINQNVASFLANPPSPKPVDDTIPVTLSPETLTNGGLKLPPFPPRELKPENLAPLNRNSLPETEVKNIQESIFLQLDQFDGEHPPFTIQRLCELCVTPRTHYRSLAKYLRAIEKSLLVTSTHEMFPVVQGADEPGPVISTSDASLRRATTPLFSPIPFLHDDARRRSASRSPPASPLSLGRSALTPDPSIIEVDPPGAVHALGLVDELDDPNPGHMSDHPQALTSVTSSGSIVIGGSLEDRFVKGSTEDADADRETSRQEDDEVEDMVLDDIDEDKENKP